MCFKATVRARVKGNTLLIPLLISFTSSFIVSTSFGRIYRLFYLDEPTESLGGPIAEAAGRYALYENGEARVESSNVTVRVTHLSRRYLLRKSTIIAF